MSLVEHRSFSPRRGGHDVKPDPLPPNPTNADLAKQGLQVHDCVEHTSTQLKKMIANQGKAVSRRMSKMEKRTVGLQHALGLDDEGRRVRRTVATMSMKDVVTFGSALSGVFVLIQVGHAMWPGITEAAVGLWNYIIGAHPHHLPLPLVPPAAAP